MNESKFTVHSLLFVFLFITALWLFISVKVVDLATLPTMNEYYPIEGTDYAVRYSSLLPFGIYQGDRNTGTLKLEGRFGFDWGAVAADGKLYLNEYTNSELGTTVSNLVCIDTDSFEKTVLVRDAMLRGRCASGELVYVAGYLMPSNYPSSNPLCRLYSAASGELHPDDGSVSVCFYDPESGTTVYSVPVSDVETVFSGRYLDRTLGEVMG